jgi:hypothetical protein
MYRRTRILAVVVTAAVALVALPATAADDNGAAERERPERVYPPAWVDQSAEELRSRIGERAAVAEERISEAKRLANDQKDEVLANLSDALDAIAAVDDPAEVAGTAISRRQLQRIKWRGIRSGTDPDLDEHIARDLAGDTRRFNHLTTIAGWAASAGENIVDASVFLDEASASLDAAAGNGTVAERHDAVHIARAWMTQAHVALLGG